MSEPEDPNIPAETPEEEVVETEAVVYEETAPDLGDLVNQMRLQVVGVGLAFLILSLAFNFYVWRHNSKLGMQRDAIKKQTEGLQEAQDRFLPVINDLAGYTMQRPQLRPLFQRHGMQLGSGTNQPAGAAR